ncbi:unnamed protein product [Symbiodinium sp. CCMP2592]|nr:unnamed protein product [Symbiodinium sp. CCMP2592]
MIMKFEIYRIEVYWVGNQKKAGVREKSTGHSVLNMSYPSYTVLIRLCNWAAQHLQDNKKVTPKQLWAKADVHLKQLEKDFATELAAGLV